jgi:hypothetical protein
MRLKYRLAAVALVAAVGIGGGIGGGRASAFYTARVHGHPGPVTAPTADLGRSSYGQGSGSGSITTVAATALKSPPATPTRPQPKQRICSTTRLFVLGTNWLGQQTWSLSNSYHQCGWASASQTGVRFPGVIFSDLLPYTGYRTTSKYTWQRADGTRISSKVIVMSSQRDYRCVTDGCLTGKSTVGGYILFDEH